MPTLIAIATFLILSGGVVFGVSRYRNPTKSEQSRELQIPTANIQLPIAPISEGTAHPVTEFKPLAIADPWESDAASTIAPPIEEVMPD